MQTTIDLPEDLVREAKLPAVVEGRTRLGLVADDVRLGLDVSAPIAPEQSSAGSTLTVGRDGLPVFQCRADAPASTMSIEDLLDLSAFPLD